MPFFLPTSVLKSLKFCVAKESIEEILNGPEAMVEDEVVIEDEAIVEDK